MPENAVNPEEAAPREEKKTLDPRIAFVLMVIMICCALCIGANKAWKKNRSGVDAGYAVWQENLEQRVETAYNILTVGGRYLAADDAMAAALREDISSMQISASDAEAIQRKADASARFLTDGKALLAALASNPAVQNDSRDNMYVTMMLPQAMEQCGGDTALNAYNAAAESYNDGMRSFSGLLAKLTGVAKAPVIRIANVTANPEGGDS